MNKKLIWKIMVRLSWVYFLVTNAIYAYCILEDGLFDTVKYTNIDEVGSAFVVLCSTILFIEYGLKGIKRWFSITFKEMKKSKKSNQNRKNKVPIINVTD